MLPIHLTDKQMNIQSTIILHTVPLKNAEVIDRRFIIPKGGDWKMDE